MGPFVRLHKDGLSTACVPIALGSGVRSRYMYNFVVIVHVCWQCPRSPRYSPLRSVYPPLPLSRYPPPPHPPPRSPPPPICDSMGWNGAYQGGEGHLHRKPGPVCRWVHKKGQEACGFQILLSCEGISSVSLMTKWLGRAALTVTPLGFSGFDPWWGD